MFLAHYQYIKLKKIDSSSKDVTTIMISPKAYIDYERDPLFVTGDNIFDLEKAGVRLDTSAVINIAHDIFHVDASVDISTLWESVEAACPSLQNSTLIPSEHYNYRYPNPANLIIDLLLFILRKSPTISKTFNSAALFLRMLYNI